MKQFRYPPRALLGDYLRSIAGLFVGLGVLLAVPPNPVILAIFGGLAGLFAVFGLRTLQRHALRVAVTEQGIACRGVTTKILPWEEVESFKLRFFGRRKTKWRPVPTGFMQLTLKGAGAAMTFESSIEGFDWLAARSASAMQAKGLPLDPATVSNLIDLGIDPGIDSGPDPKSDAPGGAA